MGSGNLAAEGWKKAAFQKLMFYIDTTTRSQWANLGKIETRPDCYMVDIHNIFGSWGTYLFFGGPTASPRSKTTIAGRRVNTSDCVKLRPIARRIA
jgi:hypothetical protein